MFEQDQYELVDFGAGRKLERWGAYLVDRPSPAAERLSCNDPELWQRADARYVRTGSQTGHWQEAHDLPDTWSVAHGDLRLELKRTEQGQMGLFPEQAGNWDWLARRLRRTTEPLNVLNLFAYTGGSTLAAAAAGARVAHVDAARNMVAWARRNAKLSRLADAPVRWITEDAVKFVDRELRRGNRYEAIILDPPSYGHGPRGEVWKLTEHLQQLLEKCAQLTSRRRAFLLLTCHTPGYGPAELEAMVSQAFFGQCESGVQAGRLWLKTADGRRLPSGAFARWPA
jgi:23S rRNA (cytosine1962-C5)-methyltransferase